MVFCCKKTKREGKVFKPTVYECGIQKEAALSNGPDDRPMSVAFLSANTRPQVRRSRSAGFITRVVCLRKRTQYRSGQIAEGRLQSVAESWLVREAEGP